jgi:Asp-tRNA(Asn)/Glu-tRNA(Gln) amidotransferase C subunit
MSKIKSLRTESISETSQMTGLENVFREDVVEEERMFSQKEALSNAKRTYKGFFVINTFLKHKSCS